MESGKIMTNLPHNTRRLEQDIVRELLEKLAKAETKYPAELYEPRRAEYVAQVEQTTKTGQVAAHPVGS